MSLTKAEQENLCIDLTPTNSVNYKHYKSFNKEEFNPTLHIKVSNHVFKNFKLLYIYEKESKSIIGLSELLDTSNLIESDTVSIVNTVSTSLGISLNKISTMSLDEDYLDDPMEQDTEVKLFPLDGKDIPVLSDYPGMDLQLLKFDNGINIDIKEDPEEIKLPLFDMDLIRPWIDIPTNLLNTSVGIHTYILRFKNKLTSDILLLSFRYAIQDDDPDKPYIYMNRDK